MKEEERIRKYIIREFVKEVFNEVMGSSGYKIIAYHVQNRYGERIDDVFSEDPFKALNMVQTSLEMDENLSRNVRGNLLLYLESILKRPLDGVLSDKDDFYVVAREFLLSRGKNIFPKGIRI